MNPKDLDQELYQAEYEYAVARTAMRIVGQMLDGNVPLDDVPMYTNRLEECTKAAEFWFDRFQRLKRERKKREGDAA
jgi:hypothetical protein